MDATYLSKTRAEGADLQADSHLGVLDSTDSSIVLGAPLKVILIFCLFRLFSWKLKTTRQGVVLMAFPKYMTTDARCQMVLLVR